MGVYVLFINITSGHRIKVLLIALASDMIYTELRHMIQYESQRVRARTLNLGPY